ncbi:MAG: GFA family protein [Alphaproteobacteria bacterium]|nr:GFA family protein [Alphaproteobacteria bacterium]
MPSAAQAADSPSSYTGSCLCGGVSFVLTAPLRPLVACHCLQCQKTSGHYVVATSVLDSNIRFTSETTLTWYRSTDNHDDDSASLTHCDRGFCRVCGGNLFWKPHPSDRMSVFAGAIDAPTHLSVVKHIYTESQADYVEIPAHLPQFPRDSSS